MMWFIGYVIVGMFVARTAKIQLTRRWDSQRWMRRHVMFCRFCSSDYRCGTARRAGRHVWPFAYLVWALWPVAILAWGGYWILHGARSGIKYIGRGVKGIGRGTVAVVTIAADSPPVRGVGDVWQWFWTDPRERKERKAVKA